MSEPLTLSLPPELLEQIAQRVVDLLRTEISSALAPASPWLDFEAACAYLDFGRDKLYKLAAARAIPCHKKQDGQGLLFHRDELDAWLQTGYPRVDRLA